MPRPFKCRRIAGTPGAEYFKPRGIPLVELEEVELTLDEFETIRLADLEELYQEDAAKRMNISRQTFGNIIVSAHKKIADVLVNGKALKITKNSKAQTQLRGSNRSRLRQGGGYGRCRRRGSLISVQKAGGFTANTPVEEKEGKDDQN